MKISMICITCGHQFKLHPASYQACPSCGSENLIREPKVGEIEVDLTINLDKK